MRKEYYFWPKKKLLRRNVGATNGIATRHDVSQCIAHDTHLQIRPSEQDGRTDKPNT